MVKPTILSPSPPSMRAAQPTPAPQPRTRIGPGLKLRLWLACLSGALVAAGGTLWLLATPSLTPSDPAVYGWLAGVACASLVVGLVLGLWIDHHVVGHLHGLLLGLRSNRVAELRGLPAGAGWGELSELGDAVQETLERRHREVHALNELEHLRLQLTALHAGVERWQLTERWERPALPVETEVSAVADILGHALQRRVGVDEQNREAARQVASELTTVINDANEAASRAERGFVEATSLQTSVRELQRLSSELAASLSLPVPPQTSEDPVGERAREALQDLVEASSASVDLLGRGLLRVQDVSDQVQRIANRATLIAIQAISGTREPAAFAEELKQLSRDVRDATDRTERFAQEIDGAVTEADARMREARQRALARLELPVSPAAPAPVARVADAQRLVERVLEMVQDASAKSERVSTASERASSVAERLARRLEANVSDAEALVVRLAPVGDAIEPVDSSTPELRLVDVTPVDRADLPADEPREEDLP